MKAQVNNKHNQPRNIYIPDNNNAVTSYQVIGARQRQRQLQRQQPLRNRNMTSTHTPQHGVHAGRSFFVNNFLSNPSPLG